MNCNGFYVVREVADSAEREFVGWKTITLDSIVMNCSWQALPGGTGMTGGPTQTTTIPYRCYLDMTPNLLSDDSLHELSNLSETIREKATAFLAEVEEFIQASQARQGQLPV